MQSRYAKLVVKDGSGNFIQLLPETKTDGSVNASSSLPPSGAAVSSWGASFVTKTGDETISGQKTFVQGPYAAPVSLSGGYVDLSAGSVFTKTVTANVTFSIGNAPAGKASQFILILENGGAYTVTWPNSVSWAGGDAPALAESGKSVLRFVTPDGTNWLGCMDGSGSGGGAKEIGYTTVEPTAANTADLDNGSIIFWNDSQYNGVQKDPVFCSGNQTISGVKKFTAGIFGGTVAMTGNAIDCSAGTSFTKTVSGNTTFSFTNVPEDATCCVTLILRNGGNYTVTWPASVKWTEDTIPDLMQNGTDVLTFITCNGGVTWYGTTTCVGVGA